MRSYHNKPPLAIRRPADAGDPRRGRGPSPVGADHLDELAADLALQRARLERTVLKLLFTGPRTAAPIAAAAGLGVEHFTQDDHRLLYAAWLLARERDLPTVATLRLARLALQAEGLWDDQTPSGSDGARHSDATLVDLAVAPAPPDAETIAFHVVALVAAAEALAGRTS